MALLLQKRAVTAVWGGSMDKRHHYRVGSHSGTWDDLPTNPDLITTQAKRNLSSFSGIGGVLSAT